MLPRKRLFASLTLYATTTGMLAASTLSQSDVAATWDRGSLTLVARNPFETLRATAFTTLHSATGTAPDQPPVLHALATLTLVSLAVIWCVPRLPTFPRVRQHWRQLSFADRATWRMR